MTKTGLLASEIVLQTRIFFRSVVAAFFTLILPLMFLIMINLFVSGETARGVSTAQYITPAIAVFGLVTATFTNLAITTSMARDSGILKRAASTPLPMWVHLGGRILSAVAIGLMSVVVMLTVGVLVFGVEIPWDGVPLFFLMLVIGAGTFSALGLAVAAITPTARAAPALVNFIILPLAFISGIFFPIETAPPWLQTITAVLPLEPLVSASVDALDPSVANAIPWVAVGTLIVWGVFGLYVAIRFFSYEPSMSGRRRTGVSIAD